MSIVDLTHPLSRETPPYPSDAALELRQVRAFEQDGFTAWEMRGGMHIGTHVDVPMHMAADVRTVGEYPLDAFCGPAQLIWLPGEERITADMLGDIRAPVVLIGTGWGAGFFDEPERYFAQHPCLTLEAARRLMDSGVRLLGFDFPSPDRAPFPVHRALLEAGVLLCENLTNLAALRGKRFDFYAAPLKIAAEGSPVRAFAVTEGCL